MDIGYITDRGNVRKDNQDRYLVMEEQTGKGDILLCVVADGMGGTGDGSMASAFVVKRMQQWWESELPKLLSKEPVYVHLSRSLDQCILACNREIFRQARQCHISTGTTCSVLMAVRKQVLIKHLGDSRIYLGRYGEWTQLTQDHTWEQQEKAAGRNPLEDSGYKQKKGALVNALGTLEICRIDTQMLQMAERDCFLLCSDGFYRYMTDLEAGKDSLGRVTLWGMPVGICPAQRILNQEADRIKKTRADDNFTAVLAVNGGKKGMGRYG